VKVLSAKVDGKDVKRMREFVDQLKVKMDQGSSFSEVRARIKFP